MCSGVSQHRTPKVAWYNRPVEVLRAASSVVEHVAFNHGVDGSIPSRPTIVPRETSVGLEVKLHSCNKCSRAPRTYKPWVTDLRYFPQINFSFSKDSKRLVLPI